MNKGRWLCVAWALLCSAAPAAAAPPPVACPAHRTVPAKATVITSWSRPNTVACPPAPVRGVVEALICLVLLGGLATIGGWAARRDTARVVFS